MRAETIARNYAEALFELGEKSDRTEELARWLDALAGAIEVTPRVQGVLLAPKIPKGEKARLLTESVAQAPNEFKLFLHAVVKRGRQGLLGEINRAYLQLLDVKFNRVRAGVTLARKPDEALRSAIVASLSRRLEKEVIATFSEDPAILGGVVVRLGDRVLDGSVKRRMTRLRRQLLK